MVNKDLKVSPYPIPELARFLGPFRKHFYRAESLHTLERLVTGLMADIEYKSGAGIAEAVAGLSDSALYRLMTRTQWDYRALNRDRGQVMLERAVAGDGVLVVDDT